MQIRKLTVERYKSFYEPCTLELRPLTIFVGRNNAGKSALARALPLLAGSLLTEERDTGPLPLESFELVHGRSFVDLVARRAVHGHVRLCVEFDEHDQTVLDVTVQNVVNPSAPARPIITSWELSAPNLGKLTLRRKSLDLDIYNIEHLQHGAIASREREVGWRGLVPDPTVIGEVLPNGPHLVPLRNLSEWFRRLRYLRSPRRLTESPYATPDTPPYSTGTDGRDAPGALAASTGLREQVRAWFEETFDVSLDVRQFGSYSSVEIHGGVSETPIEIAQAGQGLSHVLPVVVQVMTASEAGSGVDIIEHPEAELHPRAHAAVADLILANLPGPSRPVLVETHSEVFILRIRRMIAEGRCAPDDVAIYWIDAGEDGAEPKRINITVDGEVEGWPEGVFLEDYEEILAIRRAARDRRA